MTWTPRPHPIASYAPPETPGEFLEHAANLEIYGDSGICRHLPYLSGLVQPGDRVVELGMGGGDQSTVAWIAGRPKSLDSYDVNEPPSLAVIGGLAKYNGIDFRFHHGSTADMEIVESDILFIDTLHDCATVEIELARFAPLCRRQIVFHDVVAFGRVGQFSPANTGINLAIAEFLFQHPEWRVERYSTEDNGLLTLRRDVTI